MLQLPRHRLAEHHDDGWSGPKSRCGGLPDLTMLDVPHHDYVDFHLQPRDHGFPVDEFASNGARGEICDLRGLPHQQ